MDLSACLPLMGDGSDGGDRPPNGQGGKHTVCNIDWGKKNACIKNTRKPLMPCRWPQQGRRLWKGSQILQ
jgi:hypothetical protein